MNYLVKQTANLMTMVNLSLGLIALLAAIRGNYIGSLIYILVAAGVDLLDGMVARKFNIVSGIGKYLDSNADLISFGVAPALLIYLSRLGSWPVLGGIVCLIFVICGSYRLAKFNSVDFAGYYTGIPITLGGPLLAICVLLPETLTVYIIQGIALALAYMMVGKFKVRKFWVKKG